MKSRAPFAVSVAALAATLAVLSVLLLCYGPTTTYTLGDAIRGALALVGATDPLEATPQRILELRVWRTLTAAGVGASLALAGALLQGLFRNGLAAPSLVGVTGGAGLGATLAIVVLGGYGPTLLLAGNSTWMPYLLTASAFCGALVACFAVLTIATRDGTVSVPSLLLAGVALNTCVAGALATLQALTFDHHEVSRAIVAWTFGTLEDRERYHAVMVSIGLLVACSAIPFVATELDLFEAGEDDAASVGVATGRTKLLVLGAAAITTACAVSVAGQIAFVGLVVPHLVRLVAGRSHVRLLWLSCLTGAVFLLATDLGQLLILGDRRLPPGVLMSLIGGPFFLALLYSRRRKVVAW